MARYGIAECFGRKLGRLTVFERQSLVEAALGQGAILVCPLAETTGQCSKKGGFGSMGLPGQAREIVCLSL